jgi:hypothetical protein
VRREFHPKKREHLMQANTNKEAVISQTELRKRFKYLPEGRLERRGRPDSKVGYICTDGHLATQIGDHFYYLHRLIFMYHHGYFPPQIDHINRNKLDNRIENLRSCTHSENILNRDKSDTAKSFSSRYRGVSWEAGKTPESKHWRAYIVVNGRLTSVGYFPTEDIASKIRDMEVVRRGLVDIMLLNHPHLLQAYSAICFDPISLFDI